MRMSSGSNPTKGANMPAKSKPVLYRISEGFEDCAFKHVGDFPLSQFPSAYPPQIQYLATYLRAEPSITEVSVRYEDGKILLIRKADSDGD